MFTTDLHSLLVLDFIGLCAEGREVKSGRKTTINDVGIRISSSGTNREQGSTYILCANTRRHARSFVRHSFCQSRIELWQSELARMRLCTVTHTHACLHNSVVLCIHDNTVIGGIHSSKFQCNTNGDLQLFDVSKYNNKKKSLFIPIGLGDSLVRG